MSLLRGAIKFYLWASIVIWAVLWFRGPPTGSTPFEIAAALLTMGLFIGTFGWSYRKRIATRKFWRYYLIGLLASRVINIAGALTVPDSTPLFTKAEPVDLLVITTLFFVIYGPAIGSTTAYAFGQHDYWPPGINSRRRL